MGLFTVSSSTAGPFTLNPSQSASFTTCIEDDSDPKDQETVVKVVRPVR